jgi:hypothetical protein
MARLKKICPFTGKKCVECSLYRGRHLNLCFSVHLHTARGGKVKSKLLRSGKKAQKHGQEIPGTLDTGLL